MIDGPGKPVVLIPMARSSISKLCLVWPDLMRGQSDLNCERLTVKTLIFVTMLVLLSHGAAAQSSNSANMRLPGWCGALIANTPVREEAGRP